MLKSIAIPMNASDDSFFKALSLAGFQHEQIQACFADVQNPDFYDKVYGSPHIVRRSTLAGTSLADLFFLASFIRLHEEFDEKCASNGLCSRFSTHGASQFFGIPDLDSQDS
eukprot:3259064-Karenia_brevis.AAC.1